jgi:hypothetical protein
MSVSIRSDSRAALMALKTVSSRVVLQCGDSLQELALSNRVRLVWVPGHCGILGMRRPTHLARTGSSAVFVGRSLVFRWHFRLSGGGSGSLETGWFESRMWQKKPNPGFTRYLLLDLAA